MSYTNTSGRTKRQFKSFSFFEINICMIFLLIRLVSSVFNKFILFKIKIFSTFFLFLVLTTIHKLRDRAGILDLPCMRYYSFTHVASLTWIELKFYTQCNKIIFLYKNIYVCSASLLKSYGICNESV